MTSRRNLASWRNNAPRDETEIKRVTNTSHGLGDTYPKADRKLLRSGRKFSGCRRWQSSLRAPSTMCRAREVTLERRRKRARWWRTSPLSCSIAKVRSLPAKCCSSGMSRRKPSQSSVTKTLPSTPTLSSSRRRRRRCLRRRPCRAVAGKSRHHAHPTPRPGFAVPQDRRLARAKPCFFPVHEVPHLVDLDDVVLRRGRRRGRSLAGRADPLVDGDVADPEQLGDHALADVAQGVEQHRQRLHRRRLAPGRGRREAAAARLAAVALAAVRHAVPDERSAPAVLAAQPAHAAPPRPGSPARK